MNGRKRYYVTSGSDGGPWYIRDHGQIMGHCGIERDARLIVDALNAYHAPVASPSESDTSTILSQTTGEDKPMK